jgi:hypothetical protein
MAVQITVQHNRVGFVKI